MYILIVYIAFIVSYSMASITLRSVMYFYCCIHLDSCKKEINI